MTRCEHCERFSGRYTMQNACCQVRLVALMPKARRLAAFAKVRSQKGDEAAQALREAVSLEYRRWKAYRN